MLQNAISLQSFIDLSAPANGLIGGTSKERMELSLVLFKTTPPASRRIIYLPLLLSAEFQ
ncbi:hypothetical protein F2Q68_00041023 [Brassica cretica]|uniref:Uncharacterized protein n=1 Tax=Brassica cretica TaxID=69181 RepID=A0A8S9MGK7_BRACR|nr:hypothetical protein F2Q68_00041023 [Brassica cretica]